MIVVEALKSLSKSFTIFYKEIFANE